MTRLHTLALAVFVSSLGLAAGCGAASGCDFRDDDDGEQRCQEAQGLLSAGPVYQGTCESVGGVFQPDGCPREGIVAGCQQEDGSDAAGAVDWYYSGTAEEIQADCEADDGAFLTP